MLAEQTLLNAAVLTTDLTAEDAAVAGFVFNVLLIARAPLQLFQAVQGSLLPHLAGLEASADRAAARRAVRITVLAIAGFAGAVAIGLLAIGPWVMDVLFDDGATLRPLGPGARRARHGPAPDRRHAQPVGARARRGRARRGGMADLRRRRSSLWLVAPVVDDELLRAEIGYLGAAALLCGLLAVLYRRVG